MLTDVDDDVPSLEEQQGLSASIPASENLESNLESNLSACENSNTTYAAVAASAEAPRVNEDDTLVSSNYRNELLLSSFERENFHPDNVTPERPCTAYFQSDVFEDSSAVFDSLKNPGFASSAIRCLQRRPTGEMLITFSSVHVKNAFLEKKPSLPPKPSLPASLCGFGILLSPRPAANAAQKIILRPLGSLNVAFIADGPATAPNSAICPRFAVYAFPMVMRPQVVLSFITVPMYPLPSLLRRGSHILGPLRPENSWTLPEKPKRISAGPSKKKTSA